MWVFLKGSDFEVEQIKIMIFAAFFLSFIEV